MIIALHKAWARMSAVLLMSVLVSACGNTQVTRCEAPRPEICTEQFTPVCATQQDGTLVNYPNACYACRDDKVASYVAGQCE